MAKNIEEIFKTTQMNGIGELEGSRDNDMKRAFIDITKRDTEEANQYNIDITIYVRPDVPAAQVMPALQKTCIDVFGHNPGDAIELFYHPGQLEDGRAIGIEVMGKPGVFQSFGVTVKHPRSRMFSIDRLKSVFLKRAYHHLEGIS